MTPTSNGKYLINNPYGKPLHIKQYGITHSNGTLVYYHEHFDTTFYEDVNSNAVNLLFNPYPPIRQLLSDILNRPNKPIKLPNLTYEDPHRFAHMFYQSAAEFIQNNEIYQAHMCKKHLIIIWRNL